jgi:SAM-dependent methyltransferase
MDARAWDERYAASELVWTAGPNQFVEAECAGLTPGEALDLACGEGRNAIWLARQGWRVRASDFSQVALDKGRALAGDLPVTWRCEDATTWDPAAEDVTVDLAVLAYLQLPASERAAAVRHAYGALAPGGTLVVVAHDSSNLTDGTGGPQDPAVLYTADDVLADLGDAAYDVVRAGRVAREVTSDDGHGGEVALTAWDCLVRVVRRG